MKLYLRFNVGYRHDEFTLRVFPGVFHPGIYFSTGCLYNFIKSNELRNRSFLELGCGAGLISMLAFRMGANVTAVDVDPLAVKNTSSNFATNFNTATGYTIIQSDLFLNLSEKKFDIITINPPYFFKKVEANSQYAWYCGENGEYFEKLFTGLPHHIYPESSIWMILADNCDRDRISAIAAAHGFVMNVVSEKKIKWEMNYIYEILPVKHSF